MGFGIISTPSSPTVEERRDAERERRIARARSDRDSAAPTPAAVLAAAGARGNGGPPDMAPVEELRAIGTLLYGRRYVQELAEALGEDPRQLRRWLSGEAPMPVRPLAWARDAARRRASEIIRLVGER